MGCGIAAIMPLVLILIFAIILIVNNRPPSIVIPSHSVPKVNGYDDFKMAALMSTGYTSVNGPDTWTMPQLERFAKANAPMLAIVRRGLSKECMCPVLRDSNTMFPEFVGMREVARALRSEAYYYRKLGDHGKAADSLLDGVEFGVTVPRGGVLITHLVAIACEAIAERDLPEFIQKLNKQQLKHVAQRLEAIEKKRWPYSKVILEEGRFSAASLIAMVTDPKERNKVMSPRNWIEPSPFEAFGWSGTTPTTSDRLKFIGPNVRFALKNKTKLTRQLLYYYEASAAELSKPYTGTSKIKIPQDPFLEIMLPELGRMRYSSCRVETKMALLQVDVAARRYYADKGRYPDKLTQLVPKYLKSAPVDPFGNGKPIKYLPPKGARSFVVYSLGGNLKDDGGAPGKWIGSPPSGDLVLGIGD